MTGLHESTLALSVYNAIARDGTMTVTQAFAYLRKHWDVDGQLELAEIYEGLRYLEKRKLVTVADGTIAPTKLEGGAARTVIRHPAQQTELIFGRGKALVDKGLVLG